MSTQDLYQLWQGYVSDVDSEDDVRKSIDARLSSVGEQRTRQEIDGLVEVAKADHLRELKDGEDGPKEHLVSTLITLAGCLISIAIAWGLSAADDKVDNGVISFILVLLLFPLALFLIYGVAGVIFGIYMFFTSISNASKVQAEQEDASRKYASELRSEFLKELDGALKVRRQRAHEEEERRRKAAEAAEKERREQAEYEAFVQEELDRLNARDERNDQ